MRTPVFRWMLLSGLLLKTSLAAAQPVATDGTSVPKVAAPTPFQLLYFSVFTNYQYYRDQPLLSWKETNDNVGKIGGWRFYARDAKQPDTRTTADDARPGADEKQPSGLIEKTGQGPEDGRKP